MLTTCFAFIAVALQAGHVVALSPDRPLVAAGLIPWALREPAFLVAPGTRALVVRLAPNRLAGVVEVKLFDGTNRLCWLEDAGLIVPHPVVADLAPLTRSYRRDLQARPRRRQAHRPDFTAVDAALAGMMQAVLRAEASSATGPVVFTMPVFGMPVFNAEVFNPAVFGMPVFDPAVFGMPVF